MATNITNLKFDVGVTRDAAADLVAFPLITGIGLPVEGLATALNDGTRTIRRRRDTFPAARTKAQLGIGVPYNPNNGTTST